MIESGSGGNSGENSLFPLFDCPENDDESIDEESIVRKYEKEIRVFGFGFLAFWRPKLKSRLTEHSLVHKISAS